MKYFIAALGASTLLLGAPAIASADKPGPNDVQLCSFNMAYRTMHKTSCAGYDVNSIGHGGGGTATVDTSGGGTGGGTGTGTPTDGGTGTPASGTGTSPS